MELEALRMNRRLMMQEEDEAEEETKMSERDRIQGGQTGFRREKENIMISMYIVFYHFWGKKNLASFPVLILSEHCAVRVGCPA